MKVFKFIHIVTQMWEIICVEGRGKRENFVIACSNNFGYSSFNFFSLFTKHENGYMFFKSILSFFKYHKIIILIIIHPCNIYFIVQILDPASKCNENDRYIYIFFLTYMRKTILAIQRKWEGIVEYIGLEGWETEKPFFFFSLFG